MGRRDCLTKKNFFFTSSGAQRWAEREMGNTKKNTATLRPKRKSKTGFIYHFGESEINIVNEYKYLGIMLDENLTFENCICLSIGWNYAENSLVV